MVKIGKMRNIFDILGSVMQGVHSPFESQLMNDTSLAERSRRIQANVENVRFRGFGETSYSNPKG